MTEKSIFAQSSPRVARERESWGWRSSHCRAEETSPKRAPRCLLLGIPGPYYDAATKGFAPLILQKTPDASCCC